MAKYFLNHYYTENKEELVISIKYVAPKKSS